MKKRRFRIGKRQAVLLLLALGMWKIGDSYAAWNQKLAVDIQADTGAFDMAFQQTGPYQVSVQDDQGKQILTPLISVEIPEEGKTATISFPEGIPGEFLEEDKFLKIEYPMEKTDEGTIDRIEVYEANLDQETEETVEMTPVSCELVTEDGAADLPSQIEDAFMKPLLFSVYRGVKEGEDGFYGEVYLQITPESGEQLEALPDTIELQEEAPEEEETEEDQELLEDDGQEVPEQGVMVVYSCEIPVYLDQRGSMEKGDQV